ncbi:hypothetical protein F4604DRAFT_1938005 [Suillus subluteus]|nr:hypothetical protein F4604DRAFT_1938005 [Suillus subluteus]
MEAPSSPSSTITAPPDYKETAQRIGRLIAEAKTCNLTLLHYDGASKSMVDWFWPADGDGKKIPPFDLEIHRDEYNFRYPCCICADGGGRGEYVESAVYSWWDKDTDQTDWTARCASDRCGYKVKMDMYFRLPTVATFQYPRREQQILPVALEWTDREQTELLNRLRSAISDGITAKEFLSTISSSLSGSTEGQLHTKVIYRFEASIKVNEFQDLRAKPRCLLRHLVLRHHNGKIPASSPALSNDPDYSCSCTEFDAYIGLIASQKLHTELHVLSFLLKDRVYPNDLWDLVGERSVEAKQEERLQRHQSICTSGDSARHTTVERFLMEERKKRCQMEVSLYSQAIELLEEHWMCELLPNRVQTCDLNSPAATQRVWDFEPSIPSDLLHNAREVQGLVEDEHYPSHPSYRYYDSIRFAGGKCIKPSLTLLSTWVTTDVQEAFHRAFQEELALQAELMMASLATRRSNTYLRNLGLDLLILQAKMRHAQAEIELYSLAIENIHEFDLSDTSSTTSFHPTVSRRLREAVPLYDEDIDDSTGGGYEDYEDYED